MSKRFLLNGAPFISIIFLLVFAFFLRAFLFLHHDFYYLIDQARDLLLVKDIAVNHHVTLIGARSGLGGVFHGPLWLFMLVPTFLLSHGDPFWTLVPVFLFVGLATVAVGYLVGLKLYGKGAGFIMGLALAVTPTLIEGTISATNAQVMPLIFLLFLYSTILYLRGKDLALIFSVLLIGIGIHFESAFAVFLLPLILVALVLRRTLPKKRYVWYSLAVFLASVSNFIFFELRHNFLMLHSLQTLFEKVAPLKGYERYGDIGYRVTDRLQQVPGAYTAFLSNSNSIGIIAISIVLVVSAFLLVKQVRRKKKLTQFAKEYLFIFIIPILYYTFYIFYPLPLWPHYVLPLTIASAFFLALSVSEISHFRFRFIALVVTSLLLISPSALSLWTTYTSAYVPKSDGGRYLTQLHVADAVYADAQGKEFGYFVYHPAIYTYSMDYLLWWLGNSKYHREPSNQKHALTYVIMYEPPKNDAGSHGFWKKNVVRTTGKILSTKSLEGGFTLEKLQIDPKEQPADPNYYQNLMFR